MSLERFLLVALDTSSQSLAALEMAMECATMGSYGLKGIYVEESHLSQASAASVSLEVELSTTHSRPFSGERLESVHRAQSAHARQALEMAADRRRIEWEFDVIAGDAAQVIQAEGAGADMILMGDRSANWSNQPGFGKTSWHLMTRHKRSLFIARKAKSLVFPLTVVCQGFESSKDVIEHAFLLGQMCHHYVHVVYLPGKHADEEMALRHWLTQISEAKGVIFRVHVISPVSRMHLVGFLEAFKPGTLILPDLAWFRQKMFLKSVQHLDSSILFFRPQRGEESSSPREQAPMATTTHPEA